MKLKEIYKNSNGEIGGVSKALPRISFEVFPPKNGDIEGKILELKKELGVLKSFSPSLISITYGAGGGGNVNAFEIINVVKNGLNLTPMPHFTCVCKDKTFIEEYLNKIEDLNIENILALRGDIPEGQEGFEGVFKYANELVEFIKSRSNLSVGVAGYPEGHMESASLDEDIKNLKKKVDAGADAIFTQLFFDNSKFFEYCEKLEKADIRIPVIAGILPISSYSQTEKMIKLCRAQLSVGLKNDLEKYKDSPEDIQKIGTEFAIKQCEELIKSGISGLHFYCLNKSEPVATILKNIL